MFAVEDTPVSSAAASFALPQASSPQASWPQPISLYASNVPKEEVTERPVGKRLY